MRPQRDCSFFLRCRTRAGSLQEKPYLESNSMYKKVSNLVNSGISNYNGLAVSVDPRS